MTDQPANFDVAQIAPTSTQDTAGGGQNGAKDDDHQRWIETVMASLEGRPPKAKQALMQALLTEHQTATDTPRNLGNTQLTQTTPTKTSRNTAPIGSSSTHPVSGTTLSAGKFSRLSGMVFRLGAPFWVFTGRFRHEMWTDPR